MDKKTLFVAFLGAGLGLFLASRSTSDETDLFCNVGVAASAPLPNVALLLANTPSLNDLACARLTGDTTCGVTENGTSYFISRKGTKDISTVPDGPGGYDTDRVYAENVTGTWGWDNIRGHTINSFCTLPGMPTDCSSNLTTYGYFISPTTTYACSLSGGDTAGCPTSCTASVAGTCTGDSSCGRKTDFRCSTNNSCYSKRTDCESGCPTLQQQGACSQSNIFFSGALLNYYPPKYKTAQAVFDQLYPDIRSDSTLSARVAIMTTEGKLGRLATSGGLHPPCSGCSGENLSIPNDFFKDINSIAANTISMPIAAGLMGSGQLFANNDEYYRCLLARASGQSDSYTFTASVNPIAPNVPHSRCGAADDTMCQNCDWYCQKDYVILISDGAMSPYEGSVPTGLRGTDTTGFYLDEVASWLANNADLRPDTLTSPCANQEKSSSCLLRCAQSVNTFTIGFNTMMNGDVLSWAAENGGGTYVSASDFNSLLLAIKDHLRAIVKKNRFFAAPSIASYSTSLGLNVYFASFVPDREKIHWPGHLRAYYAGINVNTGTLQFYDRAQNPFTSLSSVTGRDECGTGASEEAPSPLWDAGACLSQSAADARVFEQWPDGTFVPKTTDIVSCYTAPQDRNVFTFIPGSGWQRFTDTNTTLTGAPTLFGLPSTASAADVEHIIRFVLGPKNIVRRNVFSAAECLAASTYITWGTYFTGMCVAGSVLGDIFHSSPVLVSQPTEHLKEATMCSTVYTGYREYSEAMKARKRIIVAGANDGMLHAFDAGDMTTTTVGRFGTNEALYDTGTGKELWAFIPMDLLPKLKNMLTTITDCSQHPYYLDASSMVGDAWWNIYSDNDPHADEWHTVLIQGERMGGTHFFALDITDPLLGLGSGTTPPDDAFLWYFPDDLDSTNPTGTATYMGYTWSETYPNPAAMGPFLLSGFSDSRTVPGGGAKWFAALNGGYFPDTSRGKGAYLVDVKTGEVVWKKEDFVHPVAASVAGVDISPLPPRSTDCIFDTLIIPDLGGELWRIRAGSPGTKSGSYIGNWTENKFFAAPSGQKTEFIAATTLAPCFEQTFGEDRDLRVFLGTGDRQSPVDCSVRYRFYALTATPSTTLSESDLREVTLTNPIPATQKCNYAGWYMTLPSTGEKVLAPADLGCQEAFFTTYIPDMGNPGCGTGTSLMSCAFVGGAGASYLYALDYITGGTIFTTTGGYCVTMPTGRVELGSGIAPAPKLVQVYYQGKLYNVLVSLASEGAPLPSPGKPQTVSPLGLIYWLEVPKDLHNFLKINYCVDTNNDGVCDAGHGYSH